MFWKISQIPLTISVKRIVLKKKCPSSEKIKPILNVQKNVSKLDIFFAGRRLFHEIDQISNQMLGLWLKREVSAPMVGFGGVGWGLKFGFRAQNFGKMLKMGVLKNGIRLAAAISQAEIWPFLYIWG